MPWNVVSYITRTLIMRKKLKSVPSYVLGPWLILGQWNLGTTAMFPSSVREIAAVCNFRLNSFFHPEDGYNIVQLGEATALPVFLENLKQTMLSDSSGRRILKEQPNITTEILHMDKLAKLPHNTFGYVYYQWLKRENVSPDTRAPVKFIDDPMHAYIFKRYRQCHDFYHAITNMPIIIEGRSP